MLVLSSDVPLKAIALLSVLKAADPIDQDASRKSSEDQQLYDRREAYGIDTPKRSTMALVSGLWRVRDAWQQKHR
jgi:hypothetical protein